MLTVLVDEGNDRASVVATGRFGALEEDIVCERQSCTDASTLNLQWLMKANGYTTSTTAAVEASTTYGPCAVSCPL